MIARAIEFGAGSVNELAEDSGVSRATLYAWRNGTRNPAPENLRRLAMALELRGTHLRKLAGDFSKLADRLEE